MQQLPWIPDVQPDTVLVLNKDLTGAVSSSAYLFSPWADQSGRDRLREALAVLRALIAESGRHSRRQTREEDSICTVLERKLCGSWPRIANVRYPVPGKWRSCGRRLDPGEPGRGCAVRLDYGVPACGVGAGHQGGGVLAGLRRPGPFPAGRGPGWWVRRLRYHRTSVPDGKSSTQPTSS